MENKLVIGILNIVEDKLREFNIMLPDDDREDSKDPIVGYAYAELHDLIKQYLEEQGVMEEDKDFVRPAETVNVHLISMVCSEGFEDGNDSRVQAFGSLRECLNYAYMKYRSTWEELEEDDRYLEDELLTQEAFEKEMIECGSVTIQLSDCHIAFERFEREMDISKDVSLDSRLRSAFERVSGVRDASTERTFEY